MESLGATSAKRERERDRQTDRQTEEKRRENKVILYFTRIKI